MEIYNVKISLNKKIFFISESKNKSIEIELFDILIKESQEFSINDDGTKYKKQLEKFDISPDKQFGNIWAFEANNNSRPILKKAIRQYASWGHLNWRLNGKDFSISYKECGDEYHEEFMAEGPSGKNTINKIINIISNKNLLHKINSILDKYNNYRLKNTSRQFNTSRFAVCANSLF